MAQTNEKLQRQIADDLVIGLSTLNHRYPGTPGSLPMRKDEISVTHHPFRLAAIVARADASWYQRQGKRDLWHASQTLPAHDRWQVCKSHLDAADLVLLFLSPDFLASPACQEQLQQVMPRLAVSVLLPLLVRPVDLSTPPLASIQALPSNGRAMVEWRNQVYI